MFYWACTNFLKQQKQPPEVFRKKGVLKHFPIFTRKHLCWSLFLVFGVNFIKKRLQHRYFPVNITNFLGAPILKNVWERLHQNIKMLNGFFGQYLQERSKTEKKNITIEFYIFKLVWVPNFNFNKQF